MGLFLGVVMCCEPLSICQARAISQWSLKDAVMGNRLTGNLREILFWFNFQSFAAIASSDSDGLLEPTYHRP